MGRDSQQVPAPPDHPLTEHNTLSEALAAAQRTSSSASIDAKNSEQSYKYASREAVASAGKILPLHGLSLELRGPIEITTWADRSDRILVTWTAILRHGKTGEKEEWSVRWIACSRRGTPEDKAIGAGMSYAYKNALINLAMIPRGGDDVDRIDDSGWDPDADRESRRREQARRRESRQEREQRPAPAPRREDDGAAQAYLNTKRAISKLGAKDRAEADLIVRWSTRDGDDQPRAFDLAALEGDAELCGMVVRTIELARSEHGLKDPEILARAGVKRPPPASS
jgi:hypothetical protein